MEDGATRWLWGQEGCTLALTRTKRPRESKGDGPVTTSDQPMAHDRCRPLVPLQSPSLLPALGDTVTAENCRTQQGCREQVRPSLHSLVTPL